MPAVLSPDAPVLAARRPARTSFDQVAVADWNVLPYWGGAKIASVPSKAKTWMKIGLAQPLAKKTPALPAAELDAQSIEWLMDKGLKEMEAVRRQWSVRQAQFAGISSDHVFLVTAQLAIWLWSRANPVQLNTTLAYDRSLNVRAALPQGAVHIAVLFSPGIDPNATAALGEEEEDNTVASMYDAHGTYTGGMVGPLPQVLRQLADLVATQAVS